MDGVTRATGKTSWQLPAFSPVTVLVGNFGSGKTEIALSYAIAMASGGERVQLVDLDIVNPYFRSREARDYARSKGVDVVAPEGEYAFADLPIMQREISGAILGRGRRVVLDVGGDDLGARALGGFAAGLREAGAQVLQVVNERRPFTDSPAGARRMYEELEKASRLRITGLVANAHLMGETTAEVVLSGVRFTAGLGEELGIPMAFAAVERGVLERMRPADFGCPVLAIERLMTTPWERSTRRGPIGRPPPVSFPDNVT